MPTIEVCVGPIASGKSTYARVRADQGAIIVSHDALTEGFHTRYRYEQDLRGFYRGIEEAVVLAAILRNKDAVIDRTHLTRESRARWINWARACADGPAEAFKVSRPAVVAVVFPGGSAREHAERRFKDDPRGRSFDEWLRVAEHHAGQAEAEPLDWFGEGFSGRQTVRYKDAPRTADPLEPGRVLTAARALLAACVTGRDEMLGQRTDGDWSQTVEDMNAAITGADFLKPAS